MSMENFKDQVLRVGQPASFAVQMKGKKGDIAASVASPSGAQIDCSVAEVEEGKLFHLCFLTKCIKRFLSLNKKLFIFCTS